MFPNITPVVTTLLGTWSTLTMLVDGPIPPERESPHLQLHVTLVCEEGSIVLIKRRGSSLTHTHTPRTFCQHSKDSALSCWLKELERVLYVSVCGEGRWSRGGGQLQDHTQKNHPAHGLPCASPGLSVMPPPSFTCVSYSSSDLTRAVIVLPACL